MNSTYHSIPTVKMNQSSTYSGLSYPSCRPLKIYRKTGAHSIYQDCSNGCQPNRVNEKNKFLGKQEDGQLIPILCPLSTITRGNGNVISFSGRSAIKSSLNHTNTIDPSTKPYFANYASYLKGRGNTYLDKLKFNATPVGTSFCETNPEQTECDTCFKTIYKPNNSTFKTQGAVFGSMYTERQKYNTIVKNNYSYQRTYGVKLNYQDSPVFFLKNKINKCVV
jgi:hypothetical protein